MGVVAFCALCLIECAARLELIADGRVRRVGVDFVSCSVAGVTRRLPERFRMPWACRSGLEVCSQAMIASCTCSVVTLSGMFRPDRGSGTTGAIRHRSPGVGGRFGPAALLRPDPPSPWIDPFMDLSGECDRPPYGGLSDQSVCRCFMLSFMLGFMLAERRRCAAGFPSGQRKTAPSLAPLCVGNRALAQQP